MLASSCLMKMSLPNNRKKLRMVICRVPMMTSGLGTRPVGNGCNQHSNTSPEAVLSETQWTVLSWKARKAAKLSRSLLVPQSSKATKLQTLTRILIVPSSNKRATRTNSWTGQGCLQAPIFEIKSLIDHVVEVLMLPMSLRGSTVVREKGRVTGQRLLVATPLDLASVREYHLE